MIHTDILDLVGNTPLLRLGTIPREGDAEIIVKLESFNPGGSVKDRIAVRIVDDAEEKGLLKPGGTVVEATSGNTGAGLALVCLRRGYRAILVMPDKMSQEKIRYLKALGAQVVITPTAVPPDDPRSYYSVSSRIAESTPNAILANQYFNPVNPETHYRSTGPEIWEQTDGKLDYFVTGMGTGGTITGTARFLKEMNPGIQIVGADIEGSILEEYFRTGEIGDSHPYLVEGIGEDMVPGTLSMDNIDDIITVSDRDSFIMARRLMREEGLFVGGSSGTAVAVAAQLASRIGADKRIVVLIPDHGDRYLSTFHGDEWMIEMGFMDPDSLTTAEVLAAKPNAPTGLVQATPDETVREALERMRGTGVSQVPVIDRGRAVGSLEEALVMGCVLDNASILEERVSTVMGDAFPEVASTEPAESVLHHLSERRAAVLVKASGNEFSGILTRFDFLKFIHA
ncbi:MAG: pyridoxal-phosphate dependent enzyme [Gemmatimonadota bacterium]|jgi:cystathionine beta-synthase|nr:pyridoxal-5'-phosphate-dependent protein subunit beta [Gemmatimonadota bacterium]MDP6529912.1 pyridoxal-phosphate dependent enzyme [Gemmatimonadota bacterium]MDP7032084.1 pyridoxal-phosphate dependent enzyme [Gemmatimonadota bacterium]